jgi:hypothetical protein
MKIYFAGSIRGGRDDAELYARLITHLATFGEVLTEHVGAADLTSAGESVTVNGEEGMTDREIHDRDLQWLESSDAVVAEVTAPSLGVGYELALATREGKRALCLFRPNAGASLSAMIAGSPGLTVREYGNFEEACGHIDEFLATDRRNIR